MKILVRAPNWVGDQILSYPFFYHLRKAFPKAAIDVLSVPWVSTVQYQKQVNRVISLPKAIKHLGSLGLYKRYEDLKEAVVEIGRQGPWDLGFILSPSLSSSWIHRQLKVEKVFRVQGEVSPVFDRYFGKTVLLRKSDHRSNQYLNLLSELPGGSRAEAFSGTTFFGQAAVRALNEREDLPGVLDRFDWEAEWGVNLSSFTDFGFKPELSYWVLAPGSAAESRRWDVSSFQQLVHLVFKKTGLPAVIVGGPAEAVLADEICAGAAGMCLNRCAIGTVASLAPLFERAKFTVTNDSGLAHLASLCGSPTHVVWGAGNPKRTSPIGPGRVQLYFSPISCWPCEKNNCPNQAGRYNLCLNQIAPTQVFDGIQKGLGESP